ncbi:MAG TPA: hypothetical protein VLM83_05915 [Anaerolineales bacterium]|nr:hypothetical protein [Anaerolineales bacterium]
MKTARVLICCVGFALLSCAACNPTKPTADVTAAPTPLPAGVLTVPISLDILISGLEASDTAEIQLTPANEQTASDIQSAGITLPSLRLHNQLRTINLPAIPLGWYQITLSAPLSYFREPLGYLFQVQETGIVNQQGFPLPFTLIPESAQDLPPCRGVAAVPAYPLPPEEQTGDIPVEGSYDTCRAECMIDISSPPKLPEGQNTADATQIAP